MLKRSIFTFSHSCQLCLVLKMQSMSFCLQNLHLFYPFIFFFYQWQLYSQFVLWLLSSINTLFLECTNGKYGKQCHNDCGYCRHMNECSHINGTCVKGCKPGYKQPMCTQSEWIVKNSKRSLSKTYFVIWYKCCLFYLIVHGIRSIFFQRFLTTNNLFRPSPPILN